MANTQRIHTMSDLVQRIRELLAAATRYSPAPWGVSNSGHQVFVAGPDGKPAPRTGMRPVGDPFPHVANVRHNSIADLIAAAPTLLAQAADELETLDLAYKEAHARAEQCEAEIERLEAAQVTSTDRDYALMAEERDAMTDLALKAAQAADAAEADAKVAWNNAETQCRLKESAEARCRELENHINVGRALSDIVRITELEEQLHRFQCGQEIESDYLCKAAMDLLASINRVTELEAALRRYGNHDMGCRWRHPKTLSCTCGLDAALAGREWT